jgi:hypothetical protein
VALRSPQRLAKKRAKTLTEIAGLDTPQPPPDPSEAYTTSPADTSTHRFGSGATPLSLQIHTRRDELIAWSGI